MFEFNCNWAVLRVRKKTPVAAPHVRTFLPKLHEGVLGVSARAGRSTAARGYPPGLRYHCIRRKILS